MPFLTPAEQEQVLSELKSLAQLFELDVVEAVSFPIVMLRVASGGSSSTLTKKGDEFLATDDLPNVEMTFVGGDRFSYRVEV